MAISLLLVTRAISCFVVTLCCWQQVEPHPPTHVIIQKADRTPVGQACSALEGPL